MKRSARGVWDEEFFGEVTAKGIIDSFYIPTGPHRRWGNARIQRCMPLIDPRPGERILDLACGFGTFTYLCAKHGADVVGLDLSEPCLKCAAEACAQFTLEGSCSFVFGDVQALPFRDGSFDKLLSIDGFEHFTHAQKARLLGEAYRVLKPDGRFIVYTPNLLAKASKVLRLNLINLALGRIHELTSTSRYLSVKEPTHIGMASPFRLRRLFRNAHFEVEFRYDISGGQRKRNAWRAFTQEKLPLLRDILNGRIALVARRVG